MEHKLTVGQLFEAKRERLSLSWVCGDLDRLIAMPDSASSPADIVGHPASCIFSAHDTMTNQTMVKVLGWYDNEWGFSNRVVAATWPPVPWDGGSTRAISASRDVLLY